MFTCKLYVFCSLVYMDIIVIYPCNNIFFVCIIDEHIVVCGGRSFATYVIDLNTDRIVHLISHQMDEPYTARWHPLGFSIAIARPFDPFLTSWSNSLRTYEIILDDMFTALYGHSLAVNDVQWAPDGTKLATASRDSTVKIW